MTPEQFREQMKVLKAIERNTRISASLIALLIVAGLIAIIAIRNQAGM